MGLLQNPAATASDFPNGEAFSIVGCEKLLIDLCRLDCSLAFEFLCRRVEDALDDLIVSLLQILKHGHSQPMGRLPMAELLLKPVEPARGEPAGGPPGPGTARSWRLVVTGRLG